MKLYSNKHHIVLPNSKPANLKITRDKAGVPHISADDFSSAIWGSGFTHAIDRYTQLMVMRILGQGRLCELLSDDDESFQIDHFFKRANWYNNVDLELAKLDSESLKLCQSYCNGVNAGIATKRHSILKLLGYQPEPWTTQDTILISRMSSYLTLAQSQAEIERFFIELVQAGISNERLVELFPINLTTFDRELIESIQLQEKIVPNEIIWNKALPRMMASNNWVVSGKHTASGLPLMANDPHLEVNRLPNVWYEQSLSWSDRCLLGMSMPGLPSVIVGRSKNLAWGATYTFMDTVDSWVEECRFGQYKSDNEWHSFKTRKEVIKRKKHPHEEIVFYENNHGVLDGDPSDSGRHLATRWAAADSGAKSIMASFHMAEVDTAKKAMAYLGSIESAWNWVISDKDNNIAYQMSGSMPLRKSSWNGFTPAPGWDKSYDWQGFVPLEQLPKSYNPEEGFIVTANQDLNHLGNVDPINMPMGNYRAQRIANVLENNNQHSVKSMQALQMDVHSIQAKLFLDKLLSLLKLHNIDNKASRILELWNHAYDLESEGAPLFEAFYTALREEVFGDNGQSLGIDVIKHLTTQTGVFIDFYQNFDHVILNGKSAWYETKTQEEAFINAFKKISHQSKKKTWGEVNAIPFSNMLLKNKLPAIFGFDSKPISLPGGRATPHQGQIYSSAGRKTSFAPSIRIVADMSEDSLHTCLAGGPSDNRFSPWYRSGLKDWLKGQYKVLVPKHNKIN